MKAPYSLQELAKFLHARLDGPEGSGAILISGLASLQTANPGELTFLSKPSFVKHLAGTRAAAVMVSEKQEVVCAVPLLRVKNSYLAYAQISALFDNSPKPLSGIHPSAVVDQTAHIASSVSIGPHAVIEAGAHIDADTIIGAGCFVGAGAVIGKQCRLHSHVSVYHRVQIGDRVMIHSASVIGADGFGFAPKAEGGWQKIHQLGSVVIGSDVEIGANTTIDRGAMDDTIIEDGVIIDNQVQIAHNVHIGKNTAIAAAAAIAGSTRIGAGCTIAGAVGIVGHISITDNVHITAMSMVTSSIKEAGSYSGGTRLAPTQEWRRNAVRFGQLDSIAKRLSEIEKKT